MPEGAASSPHVHRFSFDTRRTDWRGAGREVWTCRQCLATKVVFFTQHSDGTETCVEQVVEPPSL